MGEGGEKWWLEAGHLSWNSHVSLCWPKPDSWPPPLGVLTGGDVENENSWEIAMGWLGRVGQAMSKEGKPRDRQRQRKDGELRARPSGEWRESHSVTLPCL